MGSGLDVDVDFRFGTRLFQTNLKSIFNDKERKVLP